MLIRKLVGDALRRIGYQAIPTDLVSNLGLSRQLKKLFESQGVDTVWDVGANRGQYYRFLRNGVGFKGTILSFEPLSELNRRLSEKSKQDPDWHVFPFALGERNEQLAINVMQANDMSSFLLPDSNHTDRFRDSNKPIKTEMVDVKCLNEIYEEISTKYAARKSYLKMDTQGFDLNVIRGGAEVISNYIALQTEASVLPLYEGMPDYRETISYLNNIGFELSGVYPVTVDEKLRLIEFDCVMVNVSKINPIQAERH
jgi:FkbM family methyltransferase